MATVFISHASADDALVDQLVDWLAGVGVTDVFVDHKHLRAGEKWDDALQRASGACRVVMCVVTETWLQRPECFAEFRAARYSGKRIMPLILTAAPSEGEARERWSRILADDQGLDLRRWRVDGGLQFDADPEAAEGLRLALRAAGAVAKVGLDPEAFTVDTALRPSPFPGLAAFDDEDADAALFFGRSREIATALERLRESRAKGDATPLMILGASGSGKSSLLKAGVLPRLRRETPGWLPVRAFRPGGAPLYNLAEAFSRTLADYGAAEAPGAIRDALLAAWRAAPKIDKDETDEAAREAQAKARFAHLRAALDTVGARIRTAAARPEATLLLAIDQAEELSRADGESGEALSDYLKATLAPDGAVDWRLAFTIRSDNLPELLADPRFEGLDKNGMTLRTLPIYRFDDVVERPAERYGVKVDHELVDNLMEDAPQSDALPLLAFALERLWRSYAATGRLTLDHYTAERGLAGMIEDGAERALCGLRPGDPSALPKAPPKRLLEQAARVFVPTLVQLNDDGEAIRRIVPWDEFSEDDQSLLEAFIDWRLAIRKRGPSGDTVEVAHEALFREWARFRAWLEPERERLDALRQLQTAATVWDRAGRRARDVTHSGPRLTDAQKLAGLARFERRLTDRERGYLAAAGRAARRATTRRRTLQGALTAATLAAIAVGVWASDIENRRTVEIWRLALLSPDARRADSAFAAGPGETFRACDACPEMVVLPGGTFTMGSPPEEDGRDRDEGPQREVTIAPFAVGVYEVTFAEWDSCVAHTQEYALDVTEFGCEAVTDDEGWGRDRQPVINVSWEMAQRYVRWLNVMATGAPEGPYRLLTEAEWEYAARAGTDTAYWFGDTIDASQANFGFNFDGGRAREVGAYPPNSFGLFDMHGNVWEWVEDCWHDSYRGAPIDGSAWMDADNGDCSWVVLRGGSWVDDPQYLRSADRLWIQRGLRRDFIGFRLARTL